MLESVREDVAEDRRYFCDRLVAGAARDDQEYLCERLLLALDSVASVDSARDETPTDDSGGIINTMAVLPLTDVLSVDAPSPTTTRSRSGDHAALSTPRPATVLDVLNAAPDGLEAIEIAARFCEHDHKLEDIARGGCAARVMVERGLRDAETRKVCAYDGRRWHAVVSAEPRAETQSANDSRAEQQLHSSNQLAVTALVLGAPAAEMASYIRDTVTARPPTIAALIKDAIGAGAREASDIAAAVERRRSGVKRRSVVGELHLMFSKGEVIHTGWGRRGPEYGLPPPGMVVPPRESASKKSPAQRSEAATAALIVGSGLGVPFPRWRTMRSLIIEVMESCGQPMTTAQVVAGVLALDPARLRKGIKSEMARMREDKLFDIVGKDAGGVYVHVLKAGVKTST